MRAKHRQYTYRLTTRGIEYLTNRTPSLNMSVPNPYGQDWAIRRRHDTKTAPYNFELWLNNTILIGHFTADTMRRWRKTGYIVPHADTILAKRERCERLMNTISEEQ